MTPCLPVSLFNSKIFKTIPNYKILIRRDLMFRYRHTVLYTENTLPYFIYLVYLCTQYAFRFVLFFCFFFVSYSIFFLFFRLPPPRLDFSICGGTFS